MAYDVANFHDLLTMLAAGLLKQQAAIQREQPHRRLNIALYCGWERLTAHALHHRISPPETLADLIAWLHRPVSLWNLPMSADLGDAALLVDGIPTPLCHQLGAELANIAEIDRTAQPVTAFIDFVEGYLAL